MRKRLTATEFSFAMSFADFICYDDCILRKGGHNNGHILTIKELAEDMGVSYDNLRKVVASLVKKGVIGIHKTGSIDKPNIMIKAITVNPYIYCRGSKVNKTILGLFENSKWDEVITTD